MAKRIGTKQRKTRYLFKREIREKGKIPLSKYFQSFTLGDRVHLRLNSSVEKGQFFRRFQGLTGVITGTQKGSCYEIKIQDKDKEKIVYVHPIHLLKVH
ncbi:MAG: 50S ribosomal protein L21e [Nanoarchaeota archaeon]